MPDTFQDFDERIIDPQLDLQQVPRRFVLQ